MSCLEWSLVLIFAAIIIAVQREIVNREPPGKWRRY